MTGAHLALKAGWPHPIAPCDGVAGAPPPGRDVLEVESAPPPGPAPSSKGWVEGWT
jgi:hypothetical protein